MLSPESLSQELAALAQALLAVLPRIHEAGDDVEILRRLGEGLRPLGRTALIGRLESGGTMLATVVATRPTAAEPARRDAIRVPLDAAPFARDAIAAGQARYVQDAAGLLVQLGALPSLLPAEGVAAGPAVCVPMVALQRSWGLLVVVGGQARPEEGPIWRAFAESLGLAFEQAAVLRDLKQALLREHAAARELRRLESLVVDLAAEVAAPGLERQLLSVAAQALRLDHLALLAVEPDASSARLAEQLGLAPAVAAALESSTLGPAGGVLGAALGAGEQLIVEDVRTQPGWGQLGAALDQSGLRSAWLLPFLSADGAVQGALLALAARSGRPDPEMLELGQRYARHAALALAGSRRRSADLQAARAEALVQLARTIPHELSQPLAVIAGYAELIGNEQLRGEQLREVCLDMLAATRELSNRVQRLERVSRYETREFGPGRTLIDLDRATS